MESYGIRSINKKSARMVLVASALFIAISATGCLQNYGRLNRSAEIQQAFETNQVPSDYAYFYYGISSWPYAVMGLDREYKLHSRIWRTVDPDTDRFSHMTRFVWADFNYYPYGANILDPQGRKIGIIYTSTWATAVKVDPDTKTVEVMPHIYMGGGP
jgi:hypothetical protein